LRAPAAVEANLLGRADGGVREDHEAAVRQRVARGGDDPVGLLRVGEEVEDGHLL
jgi:hypothetical protein